MATSPRFASLDGRPVRISDTEAWWVVDGEWQEMNLMDAAVNAGLMSEGDFVKAFPHLPRLPAKAFHS